MDGDAWGISSCFLPTQHTFQTVQDASATSHLVLQAKLKSHLKKSSLTERPEKWSWWHFTALRWRGNQNPMERKIQSNYTGKWPEQFFWKTGRNCGASDLVVLSSCDMNKVHKWKKQPLKLPVFPNSCHGCFTMHCLSGTCVGKGGTSRPHPPPVLMQ